MCNLYSNDTGLELIRAAIRQLQLDFVPEPALGNFPGQPRIYPDQDAGVVHVTADGAAAFSQMRWGFPPAVTGKPAITNIRNLKSRWWTKVNGEYLLSPQYRCLVPFTRFAEPLVGRRNAWFAVPDREVSWFAGIWRPWHGERLAPVPGKSRRQRTEDDWRLYAFLTTEPNSVVEPIHPKAMPVILTDPDDCRTWLAGGEGSLALQRPLPSDFLEIAQEDPA